jgi:hypothetical protein
MKQLEHVEQVALMQWWALACKQFGVSEQLLFAIPNGGFRHISVAKALKAEGVRSGVPDLFLAVPNKDYCGLFIEMKKAKGGRASDNQKSIMQLLVGRGYSAAICHGCLAAKQCIEQYLKNV